ncbi:ribulose-phosphate 3-epimerase [Candidatus Woesearchaeota archaeon]|nr:ribulose-phosphate 3-epimerase [Candidatus Woesearchaeota archaeon]
MKTAIFPSILSADFSQLAKEIKEVEPFVDAIHIDVMDGHFVENITIGAPVVKCIRPKTKLLFDVHLMIEHPQKFVQDFLDAGSDCIFFHPKTTANPAKLLKTIQSAGKKAGIAINPNEQWESFEALVKKADKVLMMTVYPGFGGQKFISDVLPCIRNLRRRFPALDIEVDGGVKQGTANLCAEAGANLFVAGAFIFGQKDRKKAIKALEREIK